MKLLPGYILIRPVEPKKQTASGIYLEESKDRSQNGTVIAISSQTRIDGEIVECPVKIGDTVIYKNWAGQEYETDGLKEKFIEFKDIIAIKE